MLLLLFCVRGASKFYEVSSRRLAIVQHRHLLARGLLSLFSLLRAFLLTVIKRNQGLGGKLVTQGDAYLFLSDNN